MVPLKGGERFIITFGDKYIMPNARVDINESNTHVYIAKLENISSPVRLHAIEFTSSGFMIYTYIRKVKYYLNVDYNDDKKQGFVAYTPFKSKYCLWKTAENTLLYDVSYSLKNTSLYLTTSDSYLVLGHDNINKFKFKTAPKSKKKTTKSKKNIEEYKNIFTFNNAFGICVVLLLLKIIVS